ncbi:MAG TPA: metallophosphoesterase family protein [Rickettsiales bacterium]|nr:metallophosphoesterase family protein [Rickettsiales bacterium]
MEEKNKYKIEIIKTFLEEKKYDIIVNQKILESKIRTSLLIHYYYNNEIKEKIKDNSFPFEIKNEFHCTDIHGDMCLLINHIINSGLGNLNKEEPALLYKIENKEKKQIPFTMENLKDKNTIIVPNFEINPDFIKENKKFIFHGDLFNRGNESISCFIAMLNLIDDFNKKKIELNNQNDSCLLWLAGNHDVDFLTTKYIYNEKEYGDDKLEFIRNELEKLLKGNNFVFCYHTKGTNVLSSHTIFNKEETIDFLKNITGNKEQIYSKIINKIEENKDLNNEDIENLSLIVNKYFNSSVLEKKEEFLFRAFCANEKNKGLLCFKTIFNYNTIDGLKMIIGHNDDKNSPTFLNNVLCLDVGGSIGFNSPDGVYKSYEIYSDYLSLQDGNIIQYKVYEKDIRAPFLNSKIKKGEKLNEEFKLLLRLMPNSFGSGIPISYRENENNFPKSNLINLLNGNQNILSFKPNEETGQTDKLKEKCPQKSNNLSQ